MAVCYTFHQKGIPSSVFLNEELQNPREQNPHGERSSDRPILPTGLTLVVNTPFFITAIPTYSSTKQLPMLGSS